MKQPESSFKNLIQELGETDNDTIKHILDQREKIAPIEEERQNIIDQLSHKIAKTKQR